MNQTRALPRGPRRSTATALLFVLSLGVTTACTESTAPRTSPPSPAPTGQTAPAAPRTAVAPVTAAPSETAVATTTPVPPSPAIPIAASGPIALPPPPAAAPASPVATTPATMATRPPRVFRTPDRGAPPAFRAPQAAPAPAIEGQAQDQVPLADSRPSRSVAGVVVFRASARTALEGFDLRVTYPRALGTFAADGEQVDCNAGTGSFVAASDRGNGELRLLVASAQALPFPLDVFCHFSLASGAALDAGVFEVRVAEVTSDGKRAHPSLLLVDVVVR